MNSNSLIENYLEKILNFIDSEGYEEAIDLLDKVLDIDHDNDEANYYKGYILYIKENYKDAETYIDKVLKIDQNSVDALNLKGLILLNLNKKYKSIGYFDDALEIDPEYFFAIKNKGIALFNLEKYDEALESFKHALKINNKDVELINYTGWTLAVLGKFNEAIQYYDQALKIDKKSTGSMYLKSLTLWDINKQDEAINCLDKAIKIDPNYLEAILLKGQILREQENYEKALKCFKKIIEIDQEYVDVLFEIGNVYKDLRKTDKSIETYEKFIEVVRKNKIPDKDNQILRTNEYLNWVKEKGEIVTFTPRENPQYWQWSTRFEYFLGKDGNERRELEPGTLLDPGIYWTCHKDTHAGDLILLYRVGKNKGITYQDIKYLIMARSDAYPLEIWEIDSDSWKYGCDYIPLFKFENSLKFDLMKNDPYLEGWNALNANFHRQVYSTEEKYWKRLNDLLSELNPDYDEFLNKFDRKKIIAKIKTENEFETELIKNIHVLNKFGYKLEVLGRQMRTGSGGFIDILCKDKNNDEYVVIELKIEKAHRDVFSQISDYIGWVMEHKAEDKPVKGIIISRGIDNKLASALKTNPNIETIELKEVLSKLGMKLK